MRCTTCALVCAALLFGGAGYSPAAELVEGANKFNTLVYSATGNLSNGAGETFFVGRTNQGSPADLRRGLIQFDTSSIPAHSVITDVKLTLSFDRTSDTIDRAVSLHRVLQDWGQGTSNAGGTGNGGGGGAGAPATQNDATWLYTFYNSALPSASPTWNTPGGDFVSTASASTIIGEIQNSAIPYTWSGPGMIADVQSWVDNPGTNFGWLVLGDESTNGTARRFDSSDNSIGGDRPVLVIDYTTPVVPEPGSLTLLTTGAAGFVLFRRRRRSRGC
ncbi:MAG TPA: DNRLRE domain-containing protein [Pirellulales bacterium]|nr:DNRLRE domain-containing protein [Pirellulales bacterium]